MSEGESQADELRQSAMIQEFQALRTEMMGAISARLWGTLTYLAIAGGVGALFSTAAEPALLVLLIYAAVPLLWHTASRERARVRLGAYIQYVIEPRVDGIAWESYLSVWRQKIPGKANWRRELDQWRHIAGLTGTYLVIVLFCLYSLSRSGKTVPFGVGIIGFLICLEACHAFKRIYRQADRYKEIFEEAGEKLGDEDRIS